MRVLPRSLLRSAPTVLLALGACAPEPPRLVVVISVDQMRADYLDRFQDQFTGGLAGLLDAGAIFTDAHQDHAFTSTAPGHTTIATGTFPSHHGVVQNDWYDRVAGRRTYSQCE